MSHQEVKMKIGIDIEKIDRFKLDRKNSFLINNFSEKELDYAFLTSNPESSLCGFFCAKEALIKTINENRLLMKDIEIIHNTSGEPKIRILKETDKKFLLSISHCESYSIAVVIRL